MKIGSLISGKFRIERVIGRGAMGVVLEATDMNLGRRVAVKLILPQHAQDEKLRGRFIREATVMTRLSSEHVVGVLEAGELEDGMLFLAMELLEGQSLEQLVQSGGPLPVADAVDLILEALDAVAEAHELGLVHRDLKPSNLFLTARYGKGPILKVIDFGIVKDTYSAAKLTATGTLPGTPAYMAPEQIALQEELIDARADVWSLGVTLYELLTGELPFNGAMNVMLTRIRTEAAPRLRAKRPDVAPELEAIIERCMAKRPADRFFNGRELAHALTDLRARGLVRSERGAERTAVSTVISAHRAAGGVGVGAAPVGGGGRLSRETAETAAEDPTGPQQRRRRPGSSIAVPVVLFVVGLCIAGVVVLAMQGRFSSLASGRDPSDLSSSEGGGSASADPSAMRAAPTTSGTSNNNPAIINPTITNTTSTANVAPSTSAILTTTTTTDAGASVGKQQRVRRVRVVSARNTGDRAWRTWIERHRTRIEGCALQQPCPASLALKVTKTDGRLDVVVQGVASTTDSTCSVHPSLTSCMTDLTKDATPPNPDVCPDPSDCRAEVILSID